jgi:hypothetical protein
MVNLLKSGTMLETAAPVFIDLIHAISKHDYQFEITHGPSDLSHSKPAYNHFLDIL